VRISSQYWGLYLTVNYFDLKNPRLC
jgi:hypothetical protein